jgi:hypothetical protein
VSLVLSELTSSVEIKKVVSAVEFVIEIEQRVNNIN